MKDLQNLDRSQMANLLENFPKQIEQAIRVGETVDLPRDFAGGVEKVVFAGMGGSAIGGDVIKSLASFDFPIPIWVSRHYSLPPFVDSKTLCIFSSYSGNTEETLSAFQEGIRRKLKAVVITSGGELLRLAERHGIPSVQIPSGYPPRMALGFSVFPVLKVLEALKLWKWDSAGADETLSLLENLARKQYGPHVSQGSNPAKKLAHALFERWVVIYAGTGLLDSAALRFRNQIEENAKAMSSHHLIPEMNHNEILGWQFPEKLVAKSTAVFLIDREDHARIQLRAKITRRIILKGGGAVHEIHSQGKSRLARLFSAIYEGDWTSFYLALLYKVDPTPVPVIESLKKQLAKVPIHP